MTRLIPDFARQTLHGACLVAICGLAAVAHAHSDAGPHSSAPLKPIESLDVARYMGTWHEIARFPNRFQRKCVGFTKAEYRAQPNGRIDVINQCLQADGKTDIAVGQARQLGGANSATLEVRFAPSWMSFLPFVWGDYWVIDLDPAYSLVAVSEPERRYLWILSRSPDPDASSYQALLQRLQQKGFETERLIRTPQR